MFPVLGTLAFCLALLVSMVVGNTNFQHIHTGQNVMFAVGWLALCIPYMVRRLHDLGKSGLLVLPSLASAGVCAIAAWALVGMGDSYIAFFIMFGCALGVGFLMVDLFFTGAYSNLDRLFIGPLLIASFAYGYWLFATMAFRREAGPNEYGLAAA